MPKWIPYGENFIVGDVLRWKEPIWEAPHMGKAAGAGKEPCPIIGDRWSLPKCCKSTMTVR